MPSEYILDQLFEATILTATDKGNLRFTDWFITQLADQPAKEPELSLFADEQLQNTLSAALETEGFETVPSIVASRAEFTDAELLTAILILLDVQRADLRSDGAPEAFVPIHGDLLPIYASRSSGSVVYIWRDECDPCDAVRTELDTVFPNSHADLELFSIYGPNYSNELEETYNIIGAPTLLFMIGHRVDSRLVGERSGLSIESEVETLLDKIS